MEYLVGVLNKPYTEITALDSVVIAALIFAAYMLVDAALNGRRRKG